MLGTLLYHYTAARCGIQACRPRHMSLRGRSAGRNPPAGSAGRRAARRADLDRVAPAPPHVLRTATRSAATQRRSAAAQSSRVAMNSNRAAPRDQYGAETHSIVLCGHEGSQRGKRLRRPLCGPCYPATLADQFDFYDIALCFGISQSWRVPFWHVTHGDCRVQRSILARNNKLYHLAPLTTPASYANVPYWNLTKGDPEWMKRRRAL